MYKNEEDKRGKNKYNEDKMVILYPSPSNLFKR